jgi:hypothetical protein
MSNVNDARILKMKEQIAVKKEELNKIPAKFMPVTNSNLVMDGIRLNIQTLNLEDLTTLLVKLNSFKHSAIDLDILESVMFNGFHIEDWLTDLKAKRAVMSRKAEEQKLKVMEAKLTQLLSEDKKIELELNEFENLLK